MDDLLQRLPLVNTLMVSSSGIFVIIGWWLIRRGQRRLHQYAMLTGVSLMTVFFISYLVRIYLVGFARFEGEGLIRIIYLTVLGSHIILAIASVPLILTALYFAWKSNFARHRRIAVWAAPVWLYVAATGAVVYVMLHHL